MLVKKISPVSEDQVLIKTCDFDLRIFSRIWMHRLGNQQNRQLTY